MHPSFNATPRLDAISKSIEQEESQMGKAINLTFLSFIDPSLAALNTFGIDFLVAALLSR